MTTELQISPLEWLRRRVGATKRQIAQVLTMSEAAYGRMEKGFFNISQENMSILSNYYGVSMDIFNPNTPMASWDMLFIIKPGANDSPSSFEKVTNKNSHKMNQPQEEHEDLFLKNLENETLRKQIQTLEDAMETMKKKYLDVSKENAELRKHVKKNSNE